MEEEITTIKKSYGKVGEKSSPWSRLPREIASLIVSYLPYKNHATFRATCKSWSSLTAFHVQHQSPLLLIFYEDQYYPFNPINNTYEMPIQKPPTTKVLYSNFGWLLMGTLLDYDPSIFFFNIFTNERLDLPDFPLYIHIPISKFSFSSSPTSSDCFVLGVRIMGKSVHIVLMKLGEKDWTIVEMRVGIRKNFFMSECNPIFHNGQCFCLDIYGRLAIFDPIDPEGTFRIYGKPFSRKLKIRRRAFMVESDGELLSATISEEGQICIYKLHSFKRKWINMENLDHKILYLSYVGSWIV